MHGLAVLGHRIDLRRSGRLTQLALRRAGRAVPVLDASRPRRTIAELSADVGRAVMWGGATRAPAVIVSVGLDDAETDMIPAEWVRMVSSLCQALFGHYHQVVVVFPEVPKDWGSTGRRRWLKRAATQLWGQPPAGVHLVRAPVAAAGPALDAALGLVLDACQ